MQEQKQEKETKERHNGYKKEIREEKENAIKEKRSKKGNK